MEWESLSSQLPAATQHNLITGSNLFFLLMPAYKLDDLIWQLLLLSVFINCLIRAFSFSCHLQSGYVGWQSIRCMIRLSPTVLPCLLINARQAFLERKEARGSITLCAVCNLIWEAVMSDRKAALTCHALPEWQIRLLQLDWRVYCLKSGASLIMAGQCVFRICLWID